MYSELQNLIPPICNPLSPSLPRTLTAYRRLCIGSKGTPTQEGAHEKDAHGGLQQSHSADEQKPTQLLIGGQIQRLSPEV